jgi:metallo-beta-lactamase family protein
MSPAPIRLDFLGATGTVTGSRYLLEHSSRRALIDCGLFQGYKQLRLKNWSPLPFDARSLDAVVLTHAHIDHSGYLPALVQRGFRGRIFATAATFELCRILLPDSAFLQEEQARFLNRHAYSKHKPALPLYTQADAEACLQRFETVRFGKTFEPTPGMTADFHSAGHLLGAASVRVTCDGVSVLFSGDVGRPNDALMKPPQPPPAADYLVVESTYGDRVHPAVDLQAELGGILQEACARGAVVVVPSFAIGRAQLLMLMIARLKAAAVIPDVPVYLDSPMATDATQLYRVFADQHRLSPEDCTAMFRAATAVRAVEESKALDHRRGPMIIVSASGMATGGRVLHHLKSFATDANNLILFAGYQAGGTRGAALVAGAKTLRIHGQDVPVRARVAQLGSMSGHADANELIAWMRQMPRAPKQTFITHGEPAASDALRVRIERELQWNATVPEYRDSVLFEAEARADGV